MRNIRRLCVVLVMCLAAAQVLADSVSEDVGEFRDNLGNRLLVSITDKKICVLLLYERGSSVCSGISLDRDQVKEVQKGYSKAKVGHSHVQPGKTRRFCEVEEGNSRLWVYTTGDRNNEVTMIITQGTLSRGFTCVGDGQVAELAQAWSQIAGKMRKPK